MSARPAIGVVGLGTMGLGIAQIFAASGCEVIATDSQPDAQARAAPRIMEALEARVAAGKLTAAARDSTMANLRVTANPADFTACCLVIEAIIEEVEAKRRLFTALEAIVTAQTVLATNTSSISVQAIASALSRPERCLGLHFFNPPAAMRLVELVRHKETSPAAAALARNLTERAGKTVVECPDRPGFIVNRCARPFYGEALAMFGEGRSASEIDAAMVAAGYRMGPFSLIDLIGADINLAATEGLYGAMGNHPRYLPFPALRAQVAAGKLGRKAGKGFVFPDQPGEPPADAAAIALRIEAALVNEAFWLLAEGGVEARDIDTAMALGLNFPRPPFALLERHGRSGILAELARLHAAAPATLKPRYLPAPDLEAP